MTILSFLTIFIVSRYFTFNPEVFFPEQREVYLSNQVGIYSHIIGGVIALALGPFQFLTKLRNNRPQVHRWIGRFYLTGIFLGGVAGIYMAFFAYTGIVATIGFLGLALSWLITSGLAYFHIRKKDTVTHRKWMIRSFALTFAAVTLRLYQFPLAMAFGQEVGYMLVAYLCWIPNLIVAELIIQNRFKRLRPAI
jgi:hypothetical protein